MGDQYQSLFVFLCLEPDQFHLFLSADFRHKGCLADFGYRHGQSDDRQLRRHVMLHHQVSPSQCILVAPVKIRDAEEFD